MAFKIYKAKEESCKLCNERQAIVVPYCIIDGEVKVFPVCLECQYKIPYETIPVIEVMDKGYYFIRPKED